MAAVIPIVCRPFGVKTRCNFGSLWRSILIDVMPEPSEPSASEAFVSALTLHQSALRGYCQASLGHGEEAKEALQRTNIVLWKKCGGWDPETEFMRWATAVARYEVLGVIRDRARTQHRLIFDSDVVEKMVDKAAEVALASSDLGTALEGCLKKVSSKNLAILTAFYFQGQSIKEICAAEHRGQSAVKVLLMRLRRSLRQCIEMQLAKENVT
jgi:RNA polymerase sigma-70 factor (ECF subfamily)